ncbi:hypothetical protein BGX26_007446 [Mortierella sp. AD094]|nr:hypothetical protein BGX26_007446 [Mortierella sp. AD094]
MKVLYASIGLAAIACATAQAFDPMAAGHDTQTNFAWTPEANQSDLSAQADELSSAISELDLRAQLLSSIDFDTADFQAEAISCDAAKTTIAGAISTAKVAIDAAALVPVVGPLLTNVKNAFDLINTVVQNGLKLTGVGSVVSSLDVLAKCAVGTSKITIEQSNCNNIADMYRQAIAESIKISPALNLPADASEDLKRLAAGSLSVLDLMDKSSIATTNDALLASRPIFAADLLDQYRSELLRVATTDDIKTYAQAALGASVGISNALESCLRIAADPIDAIDELNDELEAQAYYDEEEDDDEEIDEDEEADADEVEVEAEKTEETVNEQVAA